MSNKTYKNSIIGLSVTGVIVLILGIVLSVIPLINSSPEALPLLTEIENVGQYRLN